MRLPKIFLVVLGVVQFFNCEKQGEVTLDFPEFYSHAVKDAIYPSPEQIKMLERVMPKENFSPAPSIEKRAYWESIKKTDSGKKYLEDAAKLISKTPEVPIADSIYRRANKEGNRRIYKPRYYRTMDCLERFILAECLENKGRFLPQIHTYSNAILSMKSWLHPNHDDDENGVLEGKRISIDLGARKFGGVLALGQTLLKGKLSNTLSTKINKELDRRIIKSYVKSCRELDENNLWIKSTSNWNSVCTSGTILTTLIISESYEERVIAVGSALNSMTHYLGGFGDDGYCSEGLGYWGYGFNHYLYLAQILHDHTKGKIDLFKAGNPQKLSNIGNFPEKFEIQKGKCAPFSDGVSSISSKGSNFARFLCSKYYGANKPSELRLEEAAEQLVFWQYPELLEKYLSLEINSSELANHTYFDAFGMVISRGKQEEPFSVALKAGHNKENHNHSDVGTYSLVYGNDIMAGDIGAPSYIAGAFSPDNPARSSWGHSVPRINNTLQSNGIEFKGTITNTEFSDTLDVVTMDLKLAYEIPEIQELERTFSNNKNNAGNILVTDTFSATEALVFGTAIMTLSTYKIINDKTIILTKNNKNIKAEISAIGGEIIIKDELVPVAKLREKGPAYRIGIDFKKPIKEGVITVKYSPIQ